MGTFYSKREDIDKLIEQLYQRIDSEDEFSKVCNLLDKIYLNDSGELDEDFRHEYSQISGKILELRSNRDSGVQSYDLQTVTMNINSVYEYAEKKGKIYLKNLYKLKDHIHLETSRITYIDQIKDDLRFAQNKIESLHDIQKESDEILNDIKDLNADARKLFDEITEEKKEIEEKASDANKKLADTGKLFDDVKDKIENNQKDYIAILGILAAVLVTFTSGSIFSSSVLANIDKSSIYRVSFICVVLGMVLINTVSILMLFVKWITQIRKEDFTFPPIVRWIDIFCVVLLCMIVVAWFFDVGKLSKIVQNYIYGF